MNEIIKQPTRYTNRYDDTDKANVVRVINFMNASGQTQAWVGRLANVKSGTLSPILSGQYTGNVGAHLNKVIQALDSHERAGESSLVPFVPSNFYSLACRVCDHARDYQTFTCLTAFVGVGKTRALKEYAALNTNTLLIESPPSMNPNWMMSEILRARGAPLIRSGGVGTNADRFQSIVTALKGTNTLLIVDEADKMMPRCLEFLRRIRDMAGIGIVLAGTEQLEQLIRPQHGQFDQVRSRVGMWPKTIQQASANDMMQVIQTVYKDVEGFDEDIAATLMRYADGSMRMLVENLIPTIHNSLVSRKKPLDVSHIKKAFEVILNLREVA